MPRFAHLFSRLLALGAVCSMLSAPLVAQTLTRTPIRDTLFNADGTTVNGTAVISWKSFTATDGATVSNSNIELTILDGMVAIDLTPNDGASPSGLSYRVEYILDNGNRHTEIWVVPDSTTALTVSDVRVPLPPGAPLGSSVDEIAGLTQQLAEKAGLDAPNVFSAPQTIEENASGDPVLGFRENGGSDGVFFRLPSLTQSTTYTLPAQDGSPLQLLTTDGSGNLFWSTSSGGSGAGGAAYELIQADGTPQTQRSIANFSSAFQVSDDAGQLRTDIALNFGTTAGTVTAGDDARLSDARTPLAHASSHAVGGSDPITAASIGAIDSSNATLSGADPAQPVLRVAGAAGQTAALQEWRDADNGLAAIVTSTGTAFFREMGLAAVAGGSTVSQFFQLDGLDKFALTVTDNSFDVARYDDFGVFKDRPLRIMREGGIQANASIKVEDGGVGTGTLTVTGDYIQTPQVFAPPNPASGFGRIFIDASTGELSVKKSTGQIVSLEQQQVQTSFANFIDAETPGGSVNGSNVNFTLAEAPNPPESLELTVNGVVQQPGVDFSLNGSAVTFQSGAPQSGDVLLAWYRKSDFGAGGDLEGSFPDPVVGKLRGRDLSLETPVDGECLVWNETLLEWEPGPCAVVKDALTWHFSGTPTAGAQTMVLTLPEGVLGAQLTGVRIVADTLGSTDTTFNIERCTADCDGASPTFTPIYTLDQTLAGSVRTTTSSTPDTTSVSGGEQFRVVLPTLGTGVADVTITLTYEHEAFARMDLGFEPLSADCQAICSELWKASGLPPEPFGPAVQLGDACVCFGAGPPTRG